MGEQATSATPQHSERDSDELSELRKELNRSKEETLRLRDLLIGKDAELGVLRGRLAELEEGSARFLTAATRLRARMPRLSRTIAGLRKLRSRRG